MAKDPKPNTKPAPNSGPMRQHYRMAIGEKVNTGSDTGKKTPA